MDTVAELNPPPSGESTRQAIIAVDFDGVIANYDGWTESSVIGPPRGDVVEALIALRSEGWKIIVYSCRSAEKTGRNLPKTEILLVKKNPTLSIPIREQK